MDRTANSSHKTPVETFAGAVGFTGDQANKGLVTGWKRCKMGLVAVKPIRIKVCRFTGRKTPENANKTATNWRYFA